VSWENIPLGYCVTEVKKKNAGGREKNLLSLSYGNIVRRDIATADGLLPESFDSYNVINAGDTVLRLTDLQNDQRSLRVGLVEESGIITSAYVSIRPSKVIHPKFLNYFLKHMDFRKDFYSLGAGVRQSLKFDELRSVKVPVPALSDQKGIAEYLDRETARIDALIKKKRQMVSCLNERWKVELSLTLDLVTGPTAHLSHIARISSGTGFPIDQQGNEDETIQFFKVGDLASSLDGVFLDRAPNTISSTTARVLGCRLAPAGSVVFPKVGAALLGNQRRIVRAESAYDNNLMAVTSQVLEPRYLRFVLTQFDFGELANPGPVPSINEDVVGSLRIKVPTLVEQQKVVKRLENQMSIQRMLVDKHLKVIDFLTERRQALITAAVTGEMEIPGEAK
jgi:type I restriction enzyme S subunit